MDCAKHDIVVEDMSKTKERISSLEKTVDNGWDIIKKTETRVDKLERLSERYNQQIENGSRMHTELLEVIRSIDTKLDLLAKDIRIEMRETDRRISMLETKIAINSKNFEWSWKNILALGTVATFLLGILSQVFIGKI